MAHLGNSTFVVGIDFGTTYSGYAFASKQDFYSDPPKYRTSCFHGLPEGKRKAPIAVLLNANKELVCFGYEAETTFSQLMDDEEEYGDYYYYHQFNMLLHNQIITQETEIQDYTKKSMPAITVFSLAIRFLKDHLFREIEKRCHSLTDDDVFFVLTVPTTCGDSAMHFMRKAAESAGIRRDKIYIVLESVAATLYCQTLKSDCGGKTDFAEEIRSGMKYMIIDIGGKTTDISVHKRKFDGTILEVLSTSSLPVGGLCIDLAFFNFLCEICGAGIMDELKTQELEDYIDLFRKFEEKKLSFKSTQTYKVVVTLPCALLDLVKLQYGNFDHAIERTRHRESVHFFGQKLFISVETFYTFFVETIKNISEFIEKALAENETSDVRTIVVVGGFSECELLQDAIKTSIGKSKKLIFPEEADNAVMKGAVCYGYSGELVHVIRNSVAPEPSAELQSAQSTTTKCIACDNKGEHFCYECKSALCEPCKHYHRKLPGTKGHSITNLKSVNLSSIRCVLECMYHKSEYVHFCTQCGELICSHCVTTTHKGHILSDIKSAVSGIRKSASKEMSSYRVDLQALLKHIQTKKAVCLPKLHQDAENEMKKLNTAVDKIHEVLEKRKKIICYGIENQKELEKTELEYDISSNERIYRQQESVCESIENLLTEKHDITFFVAYKSLKRELIELDDTIKNSTPQQIPSFDLRKFLHDFADDLASEFEI